MSEIIQEIKRVTNIIVSIAKPIRVIVFGSAVREGEKPADIDFLVVVPDKNGRQLQHNLLVEVPRKDWPLDLIVVPSSYYSARCSMMGSLCYNATREGKIVYERAPS